MSMEDIEVKRMAIAILKSMKESTNWERFPTTIKGVFITSVWDQRTNRKRFFIEINPTDKYSNPSKRRGYYLRSVEELDGVLNVFFEDEKKLRKILNAIQIINEEQTTG